MEDVQKQFDVLFFKIATNSFSLEFIPEIEAFSEKLRSKGLEKYWVVKLESLISTICFTNGFLEKSLDLDLKLLSEPLITTTEYYTIIYRAIDTSSILLRTDDLVSHALQVIRSPDNEQFPVILSVLNWYSTFYFDTKTHFVDMEKAFLMVCSRFGADINSELPLIDQIKLLYQQHRNSAKELSLFHKRLGQSSKDTRQKLVEEYLAIEPLIFYKELIKSAANR